MSINSNLGVRFNKNLLVNGNATVDELSLKGIVGEPGQQNYTIGAEPVMDSDNMDQLVIKKGIDTIVSITTETTQFNNDVNVGDNIMMNSTTGIIIANGFQFTNPNFNSAASIEFYLNDKKVKVVNPDPTMSLAAFLRYHNGTTSNKIFCTQGGCGVCAVMMGYCDDSSGLVLRNISVNSCLLLLVNCDGKMIVTSDGIGNKIKGYHSVQERIFKTFGLQCGACTTGVVMAIYTSLQSNTFTQGLLDSTSPGSMWEFVDGSGGTGLMNKLLDGNLCRCSCYSGITKTVKSYLPYYQDSSNGVVYDYDLRNNRTDIDASGSSKLSYLYGALSVDNDGNTIPYQVDLGNGIQFVDNNRAFYAYNSVGDLNANSQSSYLKSKVNLPFKVFSSPDGLTTYIRVTSLSELISYTQMYNLSKVKFVAGATSFGVPTYRPLAFGIPGNCQPTLSQEDVFVDINNVIESGSKLFQKVQLDTASYTFGANVKLNKVVRILRDSNNQKLMMMGDHMFYISGQHVRNLATICGGLVMSREKGFQSDVAPLLLAARATLEVVYIAQDSFYNDTITVRDYLNDQDFVNRKILIKSITIPKGVSGEIFWSNRSALREYNGHSMVNCAMSFIVNPSTNKISTNSLVVYGALTEQTPKVLDSSSATMQSLFAVSQLTVANINTLLAGPFMSTLVSEVNVGVEPAYHSLTYPDALTGYRQTEVQDQMFRGLVYLLKNNNATTIKPNAELVTSIKTWNHYIQRPSDDVEYQLEEQSNVAIFPIHFSINDDQNIKIAAGELTFTDDIKPTTDELYCSWALSDSTVHFGMVDWSGNRTKNSLKVAKETEGVMAVYTAKDVLAAGGSNFVHSYAVPAKPPIVINSYEHDKFFELLGDIDINFVGTPIAIVVATSQVLAEKVAQSMVFDYKNVRIQNDNWAATIDDAKEYNVGGSIISDIDYGPIFPGFFNNSANWGAGGDAAWELFRSENIDTSNGSNAFYPSKTAKLNGKNYTIAYRLARWNDTSGAWQFWNPGSTELIDIAANLPDYVQDSSSTYLRNSTYVYDSSSSVALGNLHYVSQKICTANYTLNDIHHFYLERICSVADYNEVDGLVCNTTSQTPGLIRRFVLKQNINLPVDRILVKGPRMGGGFGGKLLGNLSTCISSFSAAFAAYNLGRRVRALIPLQTDMIWNGARGPQQQVTLKMGYNTDTSGGYTVNSIDYDILTSCAFNGNLASPSDPTQLTYYGAVLFFGLIGQLAYFLNFPIVVDPVFPITYQPGDVAGLPGGTRAHVHNARVPRPQFGALRSFGCTEMSYMYFTAVDAIAGNLTDLDSSKNQQYVADLIIAQPFQGNISNPGLFYNEYPALFAKLLSRYDYTGKRAAVKAFNATQKAAGTTIRRGVEIMQHNYETLKAFSWGRDTMVQIRGSGTVNLWPALSNSGQGGHVKLCQILSSILQVPINHIAVQDFTTLIAATDGGDVGSMGTSTTSFCVMRAAEILKEKLYIFVDSSDNVLDRDGVPALDGDGNKYNLQADLLQNKDRSWLKLISMFSNCDASGHQIDVITDSQTMNQFVVQVNTEGYRIDDAAQGIMIQYVSMSTVDVDVANGNVDILEVDCVYDINSAMNPAIDMQQLEGGYIFALGSAFHEERLYDSNVELLTHDTWEYKPPCIIDAPENFNFSFLRNDTSGGIGSLPYGDTQYQPFGAKASQEMGTLMTCSAVAAAKAAIRTYRLDHDLPATFDMQLPAVRSVITTVSGYTPAHRQITL